MLFTFIQEAYKEHDAVTSASVQGSLVGALKTNFTAAQLNHVRPKDLDLYNRVWDLTKSDDLSQELEDSFFVPTNVFITPNQSKGECSEYAKTRVVCQADSDCKGESKMYEINNHGVRTGSCKEFHESGAGFANLSSKLHTLQSCEVSGWCPVETDASIPSDTVAVLEDTKHFQLQITNQVKFSKFLLFGSSIQTFTVQGAVQEAINNLIKCDQCQLNSDQVPHIGRIKMSSTLRPNKSSVETGDSQLSYHDIAMKGGIVTVNIHWSCFLWHTKSWRYNNYFSENCAPTTSFGLMPFLHAEMTDGRFVHKPIYTGHGAEMTRDLYKTYGIWFRFYVSSDVGRFNLMQTLQVGLHNICQRGSQASVKVESAWKPPLKVRI